ncbi:MAG: DMT family transporter [[Clostridium] innocuum]
MTKRHMGAYLYAMLLFGTLGLFVRQAHVAGDVLAFLRTLVGAAFLGVLLLFQRHRIQKIGGRQLLYVLLSAAFLGFNWVFLFEAYAAATISIATVIYYTAPLLALLAAVFLFHESVTLRIVLGIVLTMGGLLCITQVTGTAVQLKGILFAAAAALCYAGVLLTNRFLHDIDGLYFTFLQLLCSAGILFVYLQLEGRIQLIPELPAASWPWIMCIAVVHTGVAYALYFTSLHHLTSSQAAVGSYLDPCIALLLSIFLLREPSTLMQGIGIAAIVGGIIISDSSA